MANIQKYFKLKVESEFGGHGHHHTDETKDEDNELSGPMQFAKKPVPELMYEVVSDADCPHTL